MFIFVQELRINGIPFLVLSLIFTGCGDDQTDNNGPNTRNRTNSMDSNNSSAIPVQAVMVKKGDISTILMQTTTIETERQVDIIQKFSGWS